MNEEDRLVIFLENSFNLLTFSEIYSEEELRADFIKTIIRFASLVDFKKVYACNLPCFMANDKITLSVKTLKVDYEDLERFVNDINSSDSKDTYLYTIGYLNSAPNPDIKDGFLISYAQCEKE